MRFIVIIMLPMIFVDSSRITERFESALNRLTKTDAKSSPLKGKIKRYRCIEEYVSLDEQGNAIEGSSEVSREFTTMTPPVEERTRPRMHGVKNIKTAEYAIPPYKMKMYSKKKKHRTTTTTTTTTTTEAPTTTITDIEEEKDPDRLIEELYLNPQAESSAAPVEVLPELTNPFKAQKRVVINEIETPEVRYSPRTRKKPRTETEYDDYDDYDTYDEYMPVLRGNRVRYRTGAARQTFPHERTRTSDVDGYYGYRGDYIAKPRQVNPRIALPVSAEPSLRKYIHQAQPQVVQPIQTTTPAAPAMQTIAANYLEIANKESCATVLAVSKGSGIADVWTWSRLPGSCQFIQTMIRSIEPNNAFTCHQIWHFIDSCKTNHLL